MLIIRTAAAIADFRGRRQSDGQRDGSFTAMTDAPAPSARAHWMACSSAPVGRVEVAQVPDDPYARRHGRDPRDRVMAHRTVAVPVDGRWIAKLFAFMGPGYMVSVGYMDPGNWATDIAGGAQFGMTLLSVILVSNLMAVLLQALSARLGIATGRDLAQLCRDRYSRPVAIGLWFICETAIVACDIAEVIGTAIALKLLFGLPLAFGAGSSNGPPSVSSTDG